MKMGEGCFGGLRQRGFGAMWAMSFCVSWFCRVSAKVACGSKGKVDALLEVVVGGGDKGLKVSGARDESA